MADGAFPDRFPHLEPLDRKTPDTLRSLAVSWFTVKWNFPHHDLATLGLKESFAVGLEWIAWPRRKVKLRQPQRREILAGQGNRQGRVSAQMPRAMGGFGRVLQAKCLLSPCRRNSRQPLGSHCFQRWQRRLLPTRESTSLKREHTSAKKKCLCIALAPEREAPREPISAAVGFSARMQGRAGFKNSFRPFRADQVRDGAHGPSPRLVYPAA